jgi:hypothetical protein
VVITTFSLSATITIIGTNITFKLTTVYGPTRGNLKDAFFLRSWWRRNLPPGLDGSSRKISIKFIEQEIRTGQTQTIVGL